MGILGWLSHDRCSKINGRSPKVGYQTNTTCKELLYIMSGGGILEVKGKEEVIEFKTGDVILLDKNECYVHLLGLVNNINTWISFVNKYEKNIIKYSYNIIRDKYKSLIFF